MAPGFPATAWAPSCARGPRPSRTMRIDGAPRRTATVNCSGSQASPMMMFGAWLLYAQQDVFQRAIGHLAALGTASCAVLNLVKNLTSRGDGKAGQGVKAE